MGSNGREVGCGEQLGARGKDAVSQSGRLWSVGKPMDLVVGKVQVPIPSRFLMGFACMGKCLDCSKSLSFWDMGKTQYEKVWKALSAHLANVTPSASTFSQCDPNVVH